MMMKEDKWIDSLRHRMEGHTEPAPEHLWEELERELAAPRVVPMYRRYVWRAAAVVAVLLASTATVWWMNEAPSDSMSEISRQLADVEAARPIYNKGIEDKSVASVKPETPVRHLAQATAVKHQPAQSPASAPVAQTMALSTETSETAPRNTELKQEDKKDVEASATSQKRSQTRVQTRAKKPLYSADALLAQADMRRSSKYAKVEVGLSLGNSPLNSSGTTSGYQDFLPQHRTTSSASPAFSDESMNAGNFAYTQVLSSNLNDEVYSDVKHKMPVTMAATLRWNLTDRWSVETGLMYTQLSSELRSGSADDYFVSNQKLHYVGIPAKANYRLWENRWVSFYVSAGGAVEKSVSGKVDTRYILDNREEITEKHDLDVKELQWSVSSAVGVQLNVTKHVGFYLEPGLNYYFKDGSQVETIRKDRPLNFNLQAGLRFSY